jgi:hypothetical protein
MWGGARTTTPVLPVEDGVIIDVALARFVLVIVVTGASLPEPAKKRQESSHMQYVTPKKEPTTYFHLVGMMFFKSIIRQGKILDR